MTLLKEYRDNKIFRKLAGVSPEPTILSASDEEIKRTLRSYYENFPVLNSSFSGTSMHPLISIKPNSSATEYSTHIDYKLTRLDATNKWLLSPNGLKFGLEQTSLQTFNPQLETKIWKPNSLYSGLTPFTSYHERRHQTLSSLFGLPINLVGGLAPATYTEAIWYSDKKSRNIYQSPLISMDDTERSGIDFANIGRDVMTISKTWENINPNRYKFPIGVEGSGLPNSSRSTPTEEMNKNIILATQGYRYTKSTGFNPVLDGQITMNQQKAGSTFLQSLLKNVPFVNTILSFFGYGVLSASAQKIKIFNPYNVTFPYSKKRGTIIRVVDADGNLLDSYDTIDELKTPLERLLYTIETAIIAGEKPKDGLTFAPRNQIEEKASPVKDERVLYNPQDDTPNLNQYMQSYGDIFQKRSADKKGGLNIDGLPAGDVRKPYTKFMIEDREARVIHSIKGKGFANSGAKKAEDRQGDQLNLLPYGEDSEGKSFSDLIPFKFYHINNRKWIVFRASIQGLSDSISPSWSGKKFIGRVDNVYVYTGTERKLNFTFKIMINSPKEVQPIYEKINYLIGLNYPTYRRLRSYGDYMEAPFVKLTIGDLFVDVPGIIDGGITITYPDEVGWEIRDEQPQLTTDKINIAKVPRYIDISIGSFTLFNLDKSPLSSTSNFYSMVKNWRNQ